MNVRNREYDVLLGKQIAYYRCEALIWRATTALHLLDESDSKKVKKEALTLFDDILFHIRDQRVGEEEKYEPSASDGRES